MLIQGLSLGGDRHIRPPDLPRRSDKRLQRGGVRILQNVCNVRLGTCPKPDHDALLHALFAQIAWAPTTTATAGPGGRYFDIHTRTRDYCLEDPSGNAQVWIT